ncbi:N-acetyltransferase, partial [Streptomyces sp. SID10244]|nr:N-acetyltransferase [Streptomyces sp. SID10244]
GVVLGDRVTVKNRVLLFDGVTIEDDVFLGPGVTFTNDTRPRAEVKKSGDALTTTRVRKGATLGAGVTIVCGHTVGTYAFVGAGAVVVTDLVPHGLYVGNPAVRRGWACACGSRLDDDLVCTCGRRYEPAGPDLETGGIRERGDE